jgi:hypothetical protein
VQLRLIVDDAGAAGSGGGLSPAVMSRLMYVAIGLVVVFVWLVLRCYVCKPKKDSQEEGGATTKRGATDPSKPTNAGVLSRMARGVYASLPMASPPATPQRTSRQPPSRTTLTKSAPSRGKEAGEHSTDDEDYDIESCRTPPRCGKGQIAGTPPCTPATPKSSPGPLKTVMIMHDVIRPDGTVVRQATPVQLPTYAPGVFESLSTPRKKGPQRAPSTTPKSKAFPALKELSQRTPDCGMPNNAKSAPSSKFLRKEHSAASADGTDITSVSSLSGSASTPRAQWRVQGQSPPRQQAPQYQQRTPSPQQHLQLQQTSPKPPPPPLPAVLSTTPVRPVVRDGIASPCSEPPTPIKSAEKKRSVRSATSPTKRPPTGSPQRARRDVPGENDGSRGGLLSEVLLEAGWTIHVHRSGRTFFHNHRCVSNSPWPYSRTACVMTSYLRIVAYLGRGRARGRSLWKHEVIAADVCSFTKLCLKIVSEATSQQKDERIKYSSLVRAALPLTPRTLATPDESSRACRRRNTGCKGSIRM